MLKKFRTLREIVLHSALLFELGNLCLALLYAEKVAITLNILLISAIFIARWLHVIKKKPYDVSFLILSLVQFFTAGSIIYNGFNELHVGVILAATTYIAWGTGHLWAGYLESHKKSRRHVGNNPQFYYGIGDMLVVNVQGSLNVYSFPFTVLGFFKSLIIGKSKHIRSKNGRKVYQEVSSARLYALAFIIGAATSLTTPLLVVAQLFWASAYLLFGKDE
ncbi:MAG: hypothetical protein QG628_1039 [Patescibacteria group bacterium]|jgi:hypothetical protein|nr:hypothetical protein [Patescibacteria group bacterium]